MTPPGMSQLLIIFLVVLLLFGAKRIPEIARGLGKGIKEFKDATREISAEISLDDRPRVQQPRPPAQAPTPRSDTSYDVSVDQPEQQPHTQNPGGSEG